jgi:putative hydrolase of the HAD superfamily
MAGFRFIALDADDTLWHNEPLFVAAQDRFREILGRYDDVDAIEARLYETEKRNLEVFGYGVKGFTLSMIETAIELTGGAVTGAGIQEIINLGVDMLRSPVELLDGVQETVEALAQQYPLMLLTKGDLLHQENKLARSGLGDHFSVIEIVSDKNARTYESVMLRHGVDPTAFLMVGDSLRSDVLPVLEAGGTAAHVPYPTEWIHEKVPEDALAGRSFARLESIRDLPRWLDELS